MDPHRPHFCIVGDIGVDLVMGSIAQWPQIGTELILPRSELRAGGSAGNTARLMRQLRRPTRLISAVGSDDLGHWLAQQFEGLDLCLQVCPGATTISVGLMHDCSERNFFTTEGHLAQLTAGHVREQLLQGGAATPGSVALFSAPFLLPGLAPVYAELLSIAAGQGYAVALDTGWPTQGWTAAVRRDVAGWLPLCDHLLLNELEICSLADTQDLDLAMQRLLPLLKPGATLVAKVGARGARAWQQGRWVDHAAVPVEVFDTIGAGDAFNAGYLGARLAGATLEASLAAGCRVARTVLSHFPRSSLPADELSRCLAPIPA